MEKNSAQPRPYQTTALLYFFNPAIWEQDVDLKTNRFKMSRGIGDVVLL